MQPEIYSFQAQLVKALAHPVRLQILGQLRAGELCVCEIEAALEGISQSNISQHLAVLKGSHLVASRREGQKVFYWVNDARVFRALDLLSLVSLAGLEKTRRALLPILADLPGSQN